MVPRAVIMLRPIVPGCVESYRSIRLRALQDTPTAFGSTYARESRLSDADWLNRAAQWNGDRSAAFLAWDGDEPCGIVAGFLEQDEPTMAHLVSMWVAPTHRRAGVGRLLVNAVIDWMRSRGATALRLMVTSNNDVAQRFYERLGFTPTGRTEPYPNDAALFEFEMIRSIV
ncbi:MAG TPA: GNAT family N-acetyltransferase [Tepidisphaeraceae bacterium]|jgi:ribosomal protein S18 acetylase RimI-like enzyme